MGRSKSKNAGLIGLGIIGTRVAATLRKRGLRVYVWNRTPRPEQNFVGSPVEVAELCDIVQIFVSDDAALLEIVRQLVPGLGPQHVVTAHSTVSPETVTAAAGMVQRRGARFLDAPFTGSKVAAENGQLVYYIGGDGAALKQARPILEASSKEIVMIGEIGDATVMKVATNIITAATAQVGAEALALVRKAGLSAELFSHAMKHNATNSVTLEMKVPMMEAGNFEPHFSVKHMLKDVRIASKLAQKYSLTLPVTEASGDMLLDEIARGHGDADYSSVAQKYFPAREEFVPAPEKAEAPQPAEEKPVAPEPVVVAVAQEEAEPGVEEVPEGVNLSGGFRGWLSRRTLRREAREDASAV
ncbi:MAG: NAD(P)-dependent oxidoreductase [Chthoniobacterales bacterium]|nr:NAD(P)-dependent oxidoreductase [Chthoniobacterales bacterium]